MQSFNGTTDASWRHEGASGFPVRGEGEHGEDEERVRSVDVE
jgi:hypothetical protein